MAGAAAARLLNFRAAARSVALTPAALGQRIQKLEDELGRLSYEVEDVERRKKTLAKDVVELAATVGSVRLLSCLLLRGPPRPVVLAHGLNIRGPTDTERSTMIEVAPERSAKP